MDLYDYKTGKFLRELDEHEAKMYNAISDHGTCCLGTGVVNGIEFGYEGKVIAREAERTDQST